MNLLITDTPDRKFLGATITDSFPTTFPDGTLFNPDYQIAIAPGRWRLISSNYIVDTQEI
jgi:hypothetical protein